MIGFLFFNSWAVFLLESIKTELEEDFSTGELDIKAEIQRIWCFLEGYPLHFSKDYKKP